MARPMGTCEMLNSPVPPRILMKKGIGVRAGNTQAGQSVDAVAEAAGLHEHGGIAPGSVGAYGYADRLLLPGCRHQVEEGVLVDNARHPVDGDVRHVGDERRIPVLQRLYDDVSPIFRGGYVSVHCHFLL